MRAAFTALMLCLSTTGCDCAGPTTPPLDAGPDALATDAGNDGGTGGDGGTDGGEPPVCLRAADCDDGTFCTNGREDCAPEDPSADDFGCVSEGYPCAPTQTCDEERDACFTNCDIDPDADDDGVDAIACGGTDCDDSNAAVSPTLDEACDGVDTDCDPATVAFDSDGDGYEDLNCGGDDCRDEEAGTHPGAAEPCDGIDSDCMEGGGADASEDMDGDSFAPIGAVCIGGYPATDCDDSNAEAHPGGTEVCDGADNDCNDEVDEEPASLASCGAVDPGAPGSVSCTGGACVLACPSGLLDCDANVANGCESTATSFYLCGACGVMCMNGEHCAAGTCETNVERVGSWGSAWPGGDRAWGVAIDSSGNIHVVGSFSGTVDFGGGALTSAGGTDVFVVAFEPDGAHLRSTRFGGASDDIATDVAIDAADNVYVVGGASGTVDFGDGARSLGLDEVAFVVSYQPSGLLRWASASDRDAGPERARAVAVRGSAVVSCTGGTSGRGGYLVSLTASVGASNWARDWDGARCGSIGIDAAGAVYVVGNAVAGSNVGGSALQGIFLASLTGDGAHRWSASYGSRDLLTDPHALVVDGSENVRITGWYQTGGGVPDLDFGGGPLPSSPGFGTQIYLATFDEAGGHLSSSGVSGSWVRGLAVDSSGRSHRPTGRSGAPLLEVHDASGTVLSDQYFSVTAPSQAQFWDIAVGPTGERVIVGWFAGTVDFGTGPITSTGYDDALLLRLAPLP